MRATNFNLRGIKPNVMALLKQEAEKQNTSINSIILRCIEQNIGFSHQINKPTYHDLDHLAGTWKKEDANEFKNNTRYFEKIDKDMWS